MKGIVLHNFLVFDKPGNVFYLLQIWKISDKFTSFLTRLYGIFNFFWKCEHKIIKSTSCLKKKASDWKSVPQN